MQKDPAYFLVWTGALAKNQITEVKAKVKLKGFGWGKVSGRIQVWKDYLPNRSLEESLTLVNDEILINLYLDKYGKFISILGDEFSISKK